MIPEAIIDVFYNILVGLLEFLPDVSWSVDGSVYSTFLGFISVILYFFPMNTVFTIFSIVVTLMVFRIFISLIKTLWDLIPFL